MDVGQIFGANRARTLNPSGSTRLIFAYRQTPEYMSLTCHQNSLKSSNFKLKITSHISVAVVFNPDF